MNSANVCIFRHCRSQARIKEEGGVRLRADLHKLLKPLNMNLENTLYRSNTRAYPLSDAPHSPDVAKNWRGAPHPPNVVKNWQGALHRRPDAMKNMQGFPHHGRVWVKKLVQESRIRLATWNIGTLTGKSIELVDTMKRRRVNIACLQETKWKGKKAKDIDGFKLWYTGEANNKNGVGIIVDKDLKEKVVDVKRIGDRIIAIKLVLEKEIINIISAYAPQIGLDETTKKQFWENMDGLVQGIPESERIFIGGDLNGHVGKTSGGYERVHGGYGFGERNAAGEAILEFAMAYDLAIANTYFIKREEHLVTFKSGSNRSQIDFFLTRRLEKSICKDCKVIPGESLTTQHRLMVLDVRIKKWKRKKRGINYTKIRWWNLKNEKLAKFRDKLKNEGKWNLEEDTNVMWNEMVGCIKRVAKEVLGESRGKVQSSKETWWWNDEVQKTIRDKRYCYKNWQKTKNIEDLEEYKNAKKEAKKAVSDAKFKAYDDLYHKLGTKEGEMGVYKLARIRDRKCRDLDHVRCIKSEDQRVLVKDEEIKERWRSYFQKLLNEDHVGNVGLGIGKVRESRDHRYLRRISVTEVKEALKKMKIGKALGPDGIPIEAWKCMGDDGLSWLTKLFNKILRTKKIPDEWRKSIMVPIYKNKGNIQNCTNYRGI